MTFAICHPLCHPAAYAFYMQPQLMALLREMPGGPGGADIMRRAVRATLYGVALSIYAATGVAGAALFGSETQGCVGSRKRIGTAVRGLIAC